MALGFTDSEQNPANSTTVAESPARKAQKKEGGRGRSSGELELPEDCSEQRRAALLLWLRYKAERRQSYKPSGLLALVQRLKAFTDAQVTEAVSQAMANSWAGLFPEKVTAQGGIQERKKEAPPRPAQDVVGAARTDEPADSAAWRYILAQGYPDMQSAAATVQWSALPEDTREWVKSQLIL